MTLLVCLIAIFIVAVAVFAQKNNVGKTGGIAKLSELTNIKRKEPLTAHEQKMFKTLRIALPEHEILAQVAFSALITTGDGKGRNRFDRKVADFVVCGKNMEVIAIVELDDSSHRGREAQDADRDGLMKLANYRTIRYAKVPSLETIKNDIAPALETPRIA